MEDVTTKNTSILDRVEHVRSVQELQSKRLVVLMSVINAMQRGLSKAEEQFFKEIQEMSERRLSEFRVRTEDLRKKTARLVPEIAVDPKVFQLAPHQISQLQEYLQVQQQSIAQVADVLASVSREAEELST